MQDGFWGWLSYRHVVGVPFGFAFGPFLHVQLVMGIKKRSH